MNRRERRARGQRGRRATPERYQVRCAWVSDDDGLDAAKQVVHAALLREVGPWRRGPVYWKVVQEPHVDDALAAIDPHGVDCRDVACRDDQIQLGRVEHPDGYLIVGLLGFDRRAR